MSAMKAGGNERFRLDCLLLSSNPNSSPGGLGLRSQSPQPQVRGRRCAGLREDPGTKGAWEPEAGQGVPETREAPGRDFTPTPRGNQSSPQPPRCCLAASPVPRPPPQVGRLRQPIVRRPSPGAVLVPSEVTCGARLAAESVEALLGGRLSQLRRGQNMAWTLEGAKARVAVETEAPAA